MADENAIPPTTCASASPTNANANIPAAVSTSLSATMANTSSGSDLNPVATTGPDPATPTNNCANCGSHASQCCPRCAEGLDANGNLSTTYYCGQDCQREHWTKTHETQCKLAVDRRQLFRIGRLVQWAFYASTKAMWYDQILDINKIEHVNGDDGAQLHLWRSKKHDAQDFPMFPTREIAGYGGVLGEHDEQAVLATSISTGAIVCEMLDELVKGEYFPTLPFDLH